MKLLSYLMVVLLPIMGFAEDLKYELLDIESMGCQTSLRGSFRRRFSCPYGEVVTEVRPISGTDVIEVRCSRIEVRCPKRVIDNLKD